MCISWNSFLSFRGKKQKEQRYFHDVETQQFFKTLLNTAKNRAEQINKGQNFWRAQMDCHDEPALDTNGEIIDFNVKPHPPKRMKPLTDKACEGRINPKGIPYLYLSTDEKTAITEVRPWIGSYVTVAKFEGIKKLKIIDCSRSEINPMNITAGDSDKLWKLKPPPPEEAIKNYMAMDR